MSTITTPQATSATTTTSNIMAETETLPMNIITKPTTSSSSSIDPIAVLKR